MWHRRLWLIDHGACLYAHHSPGWAGDRARDPFGMIRTHVLLPTASRLEAIDAEMADTLTPAAIADIVNGIPDTWLVEKNASNGERARAENYRRYLTDRLAAPRTFVEEAMRAR